MTFYMLVVDESSVGQSKAKCVCAFLQELNDAVKAKFIEEYPEALIETTPSFFSQFTLVVATQVLKLCLRASKAMKIVLVYSFSFCNGCC